MMQKKWTAEQTAAPQAADHGWALVYDPTPGGVLNDDGSRTHKLRFPALLLLDVIDNPEATALELAEMLNEAEAARMATEQAAGAGHGHPRGVPARLAPDAGWTGRGADHSHMGAGTDEQARQGDHQADA